MSITTTTAPVRATWKQHGNPVKGFDFYGTAVKAPDAKSYKVSKCEMDGNVVVVKNGGGREVARFGAATKFWATVPADAPRHEAAAKAEREAAEPLVITAPKNLDGTGAWVRPIDGAVKAAVDALIASGDSVMALCRRHGQNPSQIRRLMADQVAKVDDVRAASIARALGVPLDTLFTAGGVKGGKPTAKLATEAKPAADVKPAAKSSRERARSASAAKLTAVK